MAMRPAFRSPLSACFIIVNLGVVLTAILSRVFGFAHGVSINLGQDQAVRSGVNDKQNIVTLKQQCLSLSISVFALSSCSLDGDEQVYITLTKTNSASQSKSSPRTSALKEANDTSSNSASQSNSASSEWDFPTVCTKAFSEINGPLCLFTSTTFASGRGISIITTPCLADIFLTLPAVANAGALLAVNNKTTGADVDDRYLPPCKPTPLPNRGIGTLATRSLRPGDPITAHTPLLLVLSHAPELLPPPELEPIFRQAAAQLPPVSRDMLLALARTSGVEEYMVHDIIQTNLFELEIGGMKHLAVFPETARVNHDCGANSQYFIDASRLTHFVHAIRPIAAGDEITITYTYPIVPHSQRHASLESFRFTCTCSRCQDPDSDFRVKRIQAIEAALSNWSSQSSVAKNGKSIGVRMAQELISLYKEEKLDAMLGRAYGFAALEYNAVKEKRGAEYHADQALWYLRLMQGQDGADVRSMTALKVNVRAHWSWGRRM